MLHTRVILLIAPTIMSIGLGCTTPDAASPDRQPQLELRMHAITPDLQLIEFDGRRIWMNRDERQAIMAKGGFEEALASPRASGYTIHATLINHTDTSYLLNFRLLDGVPAGSLKDPDGNKWRIEQVLINGGSSPYGLLAVAQTKREFVIPGIGHRLIQADEAPALHRIPPTPEHLPEWLEYEFHNWEYPARVIQDGKLGEHTTVPMSGAGRVKLTTTGPIPYR